jgi:hypothetical protein
MSWTTWQATSGKAYLHKAAQVMRQHHQALGRGGPQVQRRKLNLKANLKAVYHILVSRS